MVQRLRSVLDIVAGIIAIVGAINFALGGLAGLNLTRTVFGQNRWRQQVSYAIAGLSALWFGLSLIRKGFSATGETRNKTLQPGPRLVWKLVSEEPTNVR